MRTCLIKQIVSGVTVNLFQPERNLSIGHKL